MTDDQANVREDAKGKAVSSVQAAVRRVRSVAIAHPLWSLPSREMPTTEIVRRAGLSTCALHSALGRRSLARRPATQKNILFHHLGHDLIEMVEKIRVLHAGNAAERLIVAVVAAVSEWERELIDEQTREGLTAACEPVETRGRKQKLSDEQIKEALRRIQAGEKHVTVATEFGVSSTFFYYWSRIMREESWP